MAACPDDLRPHQAFRLVLAIALDRDLVAGCIGCSADEAELQWPSSLYGSVALAALDSPLVWRRCGMLLDAAFGDLSRRCEPLSAFEIVRRFVKGRHALSMLELAAMLWSLLRRSQRSLDPIIERLGVELEVAAAERATRQRGAPKLVSFVKRQPAAPSQRAHRLEGEG